MNTSLVRCCVAVAVLGFILLGSGLSAAPAFTRVIGQLDPLPDDPGRQAAQLGFAVLDEASRGRSFVVKLTAGFSEDSFQALYLVDEANAFRRVVSTESQKPGGGAIMRFDAYAVYGDAVYFVADSAGWVGKVDGPGGAVSVLVEKGQGLGGTDTYDGVLGVSADAGGVVIEANVRRSDFVYYRELVFAGASTLTPLLGFGTTPMPGAEGSVFYAGNTLSPAVFRDGEVLFCGQGLPYRVGFYALPVPGSPKVPRVIADNTTGVPGSGATFGFPEVIGAHPADLDDGAVAFYAVPSGLAAGGLYRAASDGTITLMAGPGTEVPGGVGTFQESLFGTTQLALSAGRFVFVGSDSNYNPGIYLHDGVGLSKLVAGGDTLQGMEVYSFDLNADAFVADQLVFLASGGLWRADLSGGASAPVSLQVLRTGAGIQVGWDGSTAGSNAVL